MRFGNCSSVAAVKVSFYSFLAVSAYTSQSRQKTRSSTILPLLPHWMCSEPTFASFSMLWRRRLINPEGPLFAVSNEETRIRSASSVIFRSGGVQERSLPCR